MKKVEIKMHRVTDGARPSADKAGYSDGVDLLRSRAEVLGGKEKVLMQMYIEDGYSFSRMARLLGVNEATIIRRVRSLTRRLLRNEYMTCLRSSRRLNGLEQNIAKDYFFKGRSQEAVAHKMGITVYRVRKTLRRLQKLLEVKRTPNMRGIGFGKKRATRPKSFKRRSAKRLVESKKGRRCERIV